MSDKLRQPNPNYPDREIAPEDRPRCNCGATTAGRWAGIHHPNCAVLKRKPICHGDGGEGERLWGLSAGHTLSDDDVSDIKNMISNYNDEIGNTSDTYYQAYRDTLAAVAPDKVDLVTQINDLKTQLTVEKGLTAFYRQLSGQGE